MAVKKWMTACVFLIVFVLASCGKQNNAADGTAETAVEAPGSGESSKLEV